MTATRPNKMAFDAGVALYAVSAFAFLTELIGEISGYYLFSASWLVHEIIAVAAFFGFLIGGVLIWHSSKEVLLRHKEIERLLRSAQGEFFEMLNLQFDRWDLSEAERDVALLTIKGMTVDEIAELRGTSSGTIKSQNNSIYKKAKVKNRTQLLGSLIDELLIEG